MNDDEVTEYFKLYTMYWKLFKKYSNLDGSDKYWNSLMMEAQAIHEQMQGVNSDLSYQIAVSTVCALQQEYRKRISEYEDAGSQMDTFSMAQGKA